MNAQITKHKFFFNRHFFFNSDSLTHSYDFNFRNNFPNYYHLDYNLKKKIHRLKTDAYKYMQSCNCHLLGCYFKTVYTKIYKFQDSNQVQYRKRKIWTKIIVIE